MKVTVYNWAAESAVDKVLAQHHLQHNDVAEVSIITLAELALVADVMLHHAPEALVLYVDARGKRFQQR